MREGEWHVHFPYPSRRQDLLRPQMAKLAKLRLDYVLPGYNTADEAEYYRLDDGMKKSLSLTLKAKAV